MTNSSIYRLVDKCFQPLSALRVLHLEGNVLNKQNFSAHTFEGLVNLEYLNMDSCKISRLSEGLFSAMPKLKYLSLKHNVIQSLDGHDPFVNSLSLVTADLSANEIRGWNSRLFQTSPMLRTLNLADNQISTISHAMFQDFSAAVEKYVSMILMTGSHKSEKLTDKLDSKSRKFASAVKSS